MELSQNKILMICLLAAITIFQIGCAEPDEPRKGAKKSSVTLDAQAEMDAASTNFGQRKAIKPDSLSTYRFQLIGYRNASSSTASRTTASTTSTGATTTASNAGEFSYSTLFTMQVGAIQSAQVDCGPGCTAVLPTGKINFKTNCQQIPIDAAYVSVPTQTSSHVVVLDTKATLKPTCTSNVADKELSHFVTDSQAGSAHLSISKDYLYVESFKGTVWFFKRI